MLLKDQEDTRRKIEQPAGPTEKAGVLAQPHVPEVTPLDETATREQLGLIRRFHLGDPAAADKLALPESGHMPALLNAFRDLRRFRYEYPLLLLPPGYDADSYVVSLEEFLQSAIGRFASADGTARILKDNLAWLDNWIRDQLTGLESIEAATEIVSRAAEALKEHLDLKGDNGANLDNDLANLVNEVPAHAGFLALSANAPFYLFHHVMQCERASVRERFHTRRDKCIRQLQQLLAVEDDKSGQSDVSRVGPGAKYLNPDNFSGVVSQRARGTISMSEDRQSRVRKALEILTAFSGGEDEKIQLVMRPGCLDLGVTASFDISESEAPCTQALMIFDEHARTYAGVLASMRIAELETDDEYEPSVHDSWFQSFDWEAFTDEELQLIPTVVAVEDTGQAAGEHMHAFSRALNSGRPIHVMMTVSAHGNPERSGEDPLHGFRMELAYVGISLRETVVNQVSSARMAGLVDGFSTALSSSRPALHLIHTGFTDPQPIHPWLLANAALESRAHPHIRFNPAVSGGGQFDIRENSQPGDDWASGEFSYIDASGEAASLDLSFTFADYCLIKPDLAGHFRKIPLECQSDDLVPVAEFLTDPESEGRSVPFVWSVDSKGVLQKLAISRELAFACRDRLGFWRNLQSMSGIHNYFVDKAIEQVREEERANAAAEIDALKATHDEALNSQRASATEDIMARLTDVLMGLDLSSGALARAPTAPTAPAEPTAAEAEPAPAEDTPAAPPEEEEEELSFDEPWIDSMLCTSCDDCLALNKMMFVYNEDKQATIKDPKAGTFAQLVQAADLCPAKCIHPGKPLDPKEPGLDELIKRAEPFN